MNLNRVYIVILALGVVACDDRNAPKTPLAASTSPAPGISGEARVALDSGNTLFRAKVYDAALGQYERAARLAPGEVAPVLGIMMVADAKKDQRLAATALERMKKLDPSLADTASVSSHSKAMKGHPPAAPPTTLPPQHPPIKGTSPQPGAASGSIQ